MASPMRAFSVSSPLRTVGSLHHRGSPRGPTPLRQSKPRVTTPVVAARKGSGADRFIPARAALDFDAAYSVSATLNPECEDSSSGTTQGAGTPSRRSYVQHLAQGLNVQGLGEDKGHRILAFKNKAPLPPTGYDASQHLSAAYTNNAAAQMSHKAFRHVPQAPERILDAPDLLDDYYLNLLDWGSSNTVAIALGQAVYLWNASTGGTQQLMECAEADNHITSVNWAADGKHLSVGTANANVQIWDVERGRQVRNLSGHSARVGALAWNGHILSSGSRDTMIINHDVRIREHRVATLYGHEQEVCGLRWSPAGNQLASGGNDNMLNIWDGPNPSSATHRMASHRGAVKALAWCPFQSNLLASGGGTADRTIKFWNSHTGALLNSVDTGSQVCALQWNRHERELLSSHGFSRNQLCLWKYPSMTKVAEMTGHTSRVLHLAQSPDGTMVVSGAADETLRFWRCFGEPAGLSANTKASSCPAQAHVLRSVNIR